MGEEKKKQLSTSRINPDPDLISYIEKGMKPATKNHSLNSGRKDKLEGGILKHSHE